MYSTEQLSKPDPRWSQTSSGSRKQVAVCETVSTASTPPACVRVSALRCFSWLRPISRIVTRRRFPCSDPERRAASLSLLLASDGGDFVSAKTGVNQRVDSALNLYLLVNLKLTSTLLEYSLLLYFTMADTVFFTPPPASVPSCFSVTFRL